MEKKQKLEKMAERMKSCCTGEWDMADCRSMMKKMMEFCQGGEMKEKKKDAEETGQQVSQPIPESTGR